MSIQIGNIKLPAHLSYNITITDNGYSIVSTDRRESAPTPTQPDHPPLERSQSINLQYFTSLTGDEDLTGHLRKRSRTDVIATMNVPPSSINN